MKKALLFCVALLPFFSSNVLAQSAPTQAPLFAVSPYEDSLYVYGDTTNFTVNFSAHQLLVDTASVNSVTGCNGLAVHPCTGEYYVVYKLSSVTGRLLGTLDVTNGIITQIGNTNDNVAGIAFLNADTLVAIVGDGGTAGETMHFVDMSTAALTVIQNDATGSDGETIASCPDNGLIYRWSGRDTNPSMQSWGVTGTPTVTEITRTGFNYDEVFGATYLGGGEFLLANLDQDFVIVDTSGFATLLTPSNHMYNKGLAMPLRYVWAETAYPDTVCPSDVIDFDFVATPGADSYQWYLDGSMIAGATNDTLNATSVGVYTCEIEIGACTLFSDNSLNVATTTVDPASLVSTDTDFCVGDSVVLIGNTGTGASEWWFGGAQVSSDTSYTATVGGTYTYRLYTAACYDSINVVVTENPLPTVVANSNAPYCEGTPIVLNGGGADTYTWDNGVADGVGFDQSPSAGTITYTVTGTDVNGCVNTATIDVTVNTVPTITVVSADDEMLGNDGYINIAIAGTSTYSYLWDDGNTQTTQDATGLTAGTYTVSVTDDATGCVITETVTIGSQVGLEEFGAGAAISIFPNPNNGIFSIELLNMNSEAISMQITNTAGQIVAESTFNSNVLPVNIQSFGAGVYNITFTDGENVAVKQIVVK